MPRATSDATGNFSFPSLEPGEYSISVARAGFVAPRLGQTRLVLAPKQRFEKFLLRLDPQAVVAGKVTDTEGTPVAGVQVSLLRNFYRDGRRQLVPVTGASTNDLGEYRLSGLAPGRYYLHTSADNLAVSPSPDPNLDTGGEFRYGRLFYPASPDAAGAAPVVLTPGVQLGGMDFRLTAARGWCVRGQVDGPGSDSSPLVAAVALEQVDAPPGWSSHQAVPIEGSRADFEICGVLTGSYHLTVNAIRLEAEEQRQNLSRAAMRVEVGRADINAGTLTIRAGVDLEGRAHIEGAGEAGRKWPLSVSLVSMDALFEGMHAAVKDDGRFVIRNLPPGRYRVNAGGGSEDLFLTQARWSDREVLEEGFEYTGESAGALEVTVSSAGGRIDGRVLDAKSQPAANAFVALMPKERQKTARLGRSILCDQAARFSIRGIPPGEFLLFSWTADQPEVEDGSYQDAEFLTRFQSRAKAITIRENSSEAVDLKLIVD